MANLHIRQIALYQKKIADLQSEIERHSRKLRALPAKFGYHTMAEFVAALESVGEGASRRRVRHARRRRTKITPEIKAKVKSLVAGGSSGSTIARTVGISLPSVQNIKKEFGLVRKRR